ncbi:MAG: pseudouridine synthase [Candidatus Hydrogenedens sp.]|nr:pseudouridine synthase [Candidatus Hydrogenedens sp.]
MRLQKYLSECGIASRRASERLITDGRVTVNGQPAVIGMNIDPETDKVLLDGAPVATDTKVYVLLNKPSGTVTTANDTHGRKTVLDCLDGVTARVFPVGRLDMDVEGVLLLTNDGELAHRLMHPTHEIDKVYVALVAGSFGEEAVKKLERGVMLEDGMTAPAKVRVLSVNERTSRIQLTIHEGRKREVKRMCAAVGHPVKKLKRIAFANLLRGDLRPGEWRYLNRPEVQMLQKLAAEPPKPRPVAR